jgi:hypothetical protein
VLSCHSLKDIYAATAPEAPNMSTYPNPDLRVYRLFMIFAIGCNLLEQRNSRLRMDSTPLRTYAFQHFTSVLRGDEIVSRSSRSASIETPLMPADMLDGHSPLGDLLDPGLLTPQPVRRTGHRK